MKIEVDAETLGNLVAVAGTCLKDVQFCQNNSERFVCDVKRAKDKAQDALTATQQVVAPRLPTVPLMPLSTSGSG